jgi:hypothetical protein
VVLIIAQFKLHIEQNHNAHRHPDRQTDQIDQHIHGMLSGIPKDDFEVILNHDRKGLVESKNCRQRRTPPAISIHWTGFNVIA